MKAGMGDGAHNKSVLVTMLGMRGGKWEEIIA